MWLGKTHVFPVCRLNRSSLKSHFNRLLPNTLIYIAVVTSLNWRCLGCGNFMTQFCHLSLLSPWCRARLGVTHVGRVYLPGLLASSPEHPPHQPGQVCPGHLGCQSGGGGSHIVQITGISHSSKVVALQAFEFLPASPNSCSTQCSIILGLNKYRIMLLLVNIYLIMSQWIQLVQVFWGKQVLDMTQGINMDAPKFPNLISLWNWSSPGNIFS